MGDAARRWNEAVEDPSALMQENANLRMLTENGAPARAQPELDAENEQLKMEAAFAANMCGMADKDRAVAMAASNLLRAKLEKWESIFKEADPEKVREYHQQLIAEKNETAEELRYTNQQLRDLWRDVDAVRSDNQDLLGSLRGQVDPRGCADQSDFDLVGQIDRHEREVERLESELAKIDIARRDHVTRLEYDLRSERLVARELTNRIAELEQEIERLKAVMASRNDEITQVLGKVLGYAWYKDDPANFPGATEADGVCVGEHVAETIAHEAANRIATLLAELAKAPQWVPVDDCVESEMECTYQVVHGTIQSCLGVKPFIYREAYYEQGEWSAGGMPVCVTHVLANLNPPDVAPNEASEWLREIASKEDNGCVSVGGLVGRVKADETHEATQAVDWEARKKELAAWAKTVHDTLYPVAPDASDAMSVAKPLVESPADCVVPCKRCNGRNLIPVSNEPCSTDMMECPECYSPTPQCVDMLNRPVEAGDMMYFISERLLNVATIKGGNYTNAVRCPRPGEVTPQFDGWQTMCLAMQSDGAMFQSRDEVSKQWPGGEWNFDGDWATEYRRSESCKWSEPKCLDMLGQDVVSSDVLWDKKCKILEKRPVLDAGDYEQCVRIPRPGETIPLSDDWRDMCLAMQESGVAFQWLCNGTWDPPRNNWPLAFEASPTRYRRSDKCTWKGPK